MFGKVISLLFQIALTVGSGVMVFTRSYLPERVGWLLLFLGFGYFAIRKFLDLLLRGLHAFNMHVRGKYLWKAQQKAQEEMAKPDTRKFPVVTEEDIQRFKDMGMKKAMEEFGGIPPVMSKETK